MALLTGIVSYWKLDESSGDAVDSVSSNNLTNHGSIPFVPGKINNGADIEMSTGQYFTIPDASQVGLDILSDFTINAWIKIESMPTSAALNGIAGKFTTSARA